MAVTGHDKESTMATLIARSIIDSHVRIWDGQRLNGVPTSVDTTPIEGVIAVESRCPDVEAGAELDRSDQATNDLSVNPPILGIIRQPESAGARRGGVPIVGVHVGVPDRETVTDGDQIVVDVDVAANQLEAVADQLDTEPTIRRYVLDYLGGPDIGDTRSFVDWCVDIDRIAAHPNVACKLSAPLTESPRGRFDPRTVGGYVDKVFDAFGVSRVIFASNWPTPAALPYRSWVDLLAEVIGPDEGLQDAVFAGNARRFYRLGTQGNPRATHTTPDSMCLHCHAGVVVSAHGHNDDRTTTTEGTVQADGQPRDASGQRTAVV